MDLRPANGALRTQIESVAFASFPAIKRLYQAVPTETPSVAGEFAIVSITWDAAEQVAIGGLTGGRDRATGRIDVKIHTDKNVGDARCYEVAADVHSALNRFRVGGVVRCLTASTQTIQDPNAEDAGFFTLTVSCPFYADF